MRVNGYSNPETEWVIQINYNSKVAETREERTKKQPPADLTETKESGCK